jgi:glycosyltransferase involved in cell wall biosynthesis
MTTLPAPLRVAVLIPCYNEALTIASVVTGFAAELPDAHVYVCDNNSTDGTRGLAAAAGAIVLREKRQGKGYALASMLGMVDADVYVLVDGDSTYPAEKVHELLAPLVAQQADHVVGARVAEDPRKAYRPMHSAGNRIVTFLVNRIFSTSLRDVMSGYRAFSRDVAENVPLLSGGFDVETEFTLQSLEKGFVLHEVPVPYRERPPGSMSKLSTVRDGIRVLGRVASMLKDFRPFAFFGSMAGAVAALSLLAGYLPVADYIRERYVYHVPLALLAAVLGSISVVLLQTGIVLTTLNARFRELHTLRRRERMRGPEPARVADHSSQHPEHAVAEE